MDNIAKGAVIGNLLTAASIGFCFWALPRWAFVGYVSYLAFVQIDRLVSKGEK